MGGFQKRQLLVVIALGAASLSHAAHAQEPLVAPVPPPASVAAPVLRPADDAAKLDTLLAELAEPGRSDWEKVEGEITRLWSRSGSPAMDLLLKRGNEALEAEDYRTALDHFSALTDHAPDFAEGWNARATAFYLMGEYSLAIVDVQRVLALNPRHFGALSGLAFMFEQMDEPDLALKALHAAQKLNPNRPNINEAVTRLERTNGDTEI